MLRIRSLLILLACVPVVAGGCGGGGILNRVPVIGSTQRYLPESGAVRGLRRESPFRTYRGSDMNEYLGPAANLYVEYGAGSMAYADYTFGGPQRTMTIEVYSMDSDEAAAGLFHYFRGRRLKGRGAPVAAGAEGVLDRDHESRNLYFYKQRIFYKLIYTGEKPVPNLVPLAQVAAGSVSGESEAPRGFEYLEMSGINRQEARVSPGFLFNYDFLPTGIIAPAPGVGPIAEVFLIGHHNQKDAERTAQDYRTYLELNGTDYTLKYDAQRRRIAFARDPNQGRVVFARHGSYVIGVVRPKTYAMGEAMVYRLIQRMRRYGE